jgi:hypothetical protein
MRKPLLSFCFILLSSCIFFSPKALAFTYMGAGNFQLVQDENHECGTGYKVGDKIYFNGSNADDPAYVTVTLVDYYGGSDGRVYNYDETYGGTYYFLGEASTYTDGDGTGCDLGNIISIQDNTPATSTIGYYCGTEGAPYFSYTWGSPCPSGWHTFSTNYYFSDSASPSTISIKHTQWDGVQVYYADSEYDMLAGNATCYSPDNCNETDTLASCTWSPEMKTEFHRYWFSTSGDRMRDIFGRMTASVPSSPDITLQTEGYWSTNLDQTNQEITSFASKGVGAVGTVLPIGIGVLATTTLLFKGLGWFKAIAGLRKG